MRVLDLHTSKLHFETSGEQENGLLTEAFEQRGMNGAQPYRPNLEALKACTIRLSAVWKLLRSFDPLWTTSCEIRSMGLLSE